MTEIACAFKLVEITSGALGNCRLDDRIPDDIQRVRVEKLTVIAFLVSQRIRHREQAVTKTNFDGFAVNR